MIIRFLLFVLILSLSACQAATPAPAVQPELATVTPLPATAAPTVQLIFDEYKITEKDAFAFEQNKRLGRGVNLGNALEAPEKEGEWGMVLEEQFFQVIKEGGFDTVRVPIRWNAYAEEKAPYTIEPEFLERIDWVVEQAKKNDLNVILDWHHYLEIMESPAMHKARFIGIWEQIAQHYAAEPDSVYFELLNEPNGTIGNSGAWNDIMSDLIPVIRRTNPNRTLIVTCGSWSSISYLWNMELPVDDRNLIVTVHYYSPFEFTHQGAEWTDGSEAWMGTEWTGTKTEQFAIQRDFDTASKWAAENGRPIFLGEFGAYSKADMDSRALWTSFIAREAEQRGWSWAYWEFGAGFGVYDREAKGWVEPIHQALIPKP